MNVPEGLLTLDGANNPIPHNVISPQDILFQDGELVAPHVLLNPKRWMPFIEPPKPITRPPAWHRVATAPNPRSGFQCKTIMKRVRACKSHELPCIAPIMQQAPQQLPSIHRSQRRKLRQDGPQSYEAHEDAFACEPSSAAQAAHDILQAKTDVANHIVRNPSMISREDLKAVRRGRCVTNTGVKRRLSEGIDIRNPSGWAGTGLAFYKDLELLIIRACQEQGNLDVRAGAIAEAARRIQEVRRNPRTHLALEGIPDISTIAETTELASSPTMLKPPTTPASSSSPHKRKTRLSDSFASGSRKVMKTKVTLTPSASSSTGISPIKPASPQSSPLIELSPIAKSPASYSQQSPSPAIVVDPTKSSELALPYGPEEDAGSGDFPSSPVTSPQKRPCAPTPSRWNRVVSSTPSQVQAPKFETPKPKISSIHLLASVPNGTPEVQPTPRDWDVDPLSSPEPFNFGAATAVHTHSQVSWFLDAADVVQEASRNSNVNKGRRRKSEPLLRKHLVAMSRRKSLSPQKHSLRHIDAAEEKEYAQVNVADTLRQFDGRAETSESPVVSEIIEKPSEFTTAAEATEKVREPDAALEVLEVTSESLTALSETTASPTAPGEAEHSPNALEETNGAYNTHVEARSSDPAMPASADPSTPVAELRRTMNDVATPLPSYFTSKGRLMAGQQTSRTPARKADIYNIDMRENLDIFGAKSATKEGPVGQLADIAQGRCDGEANVIVTEENGKLVVRFKLPTKYAELFPSSQGFDESLFTITPSGISSSPRIRTDGDAQKPSVTSMSHSFTDKLPEAFLEPSNEVGRCNASPFRVQADSHQRKSKSNGKLRRVSFDLNIATGAPDLASSPSANVVDTSMLSPRWQYSGHWRGSPAMNDDADNTLIVDDFSQRLSTPPVRKLVQSRRGFEDSSFGLETPVKKERSQQDAPSSGLISDLSFEPSFQTPTLGPFSFPESSVMTHSARLNQPGRVEHSSPTASSTTNNTAAPTSFVAAANGHLAADDKAIPVGTATLATSFVPVNRPGSVTKAEVVRPSMETGLRADARSPNTLPATSSGPDQAASQAKHDDDSPNRDYMRDFIRRAKPKRLSTTETGSPMAATPARLPLGAKSPNAGIESPQKNKRKLDGAEKEEPSPAKKPETRPLKRARRTVKADMCTTEPKAAEDGARRSSRLKSQELEAAETKSAIPTAIKLSRAGANRGTYGGAKNAAIRSEQAELGRQTSLNTKRNRGKGESVQQVLARCSEDLSEADTDGEAGGSKAVSKHGKAVAWKDPLEAHQEEKPRKSKTAAKSGIAKGSGAVAKAAPKTAPKVQASKVARSLGMVSNGTPAKRMTRSQVHR